MTNERTQPCPVCGWRLPDGWLAEPQPIADCWVITPPPGYGKRFPVSLIDFPNREDFHRAIRELVEERIANVESPVTVAEQGSGA